MESRLNGRKWQRAGWAAFGSGKPGHEARRGEPPGASCMGVKKDYLGSVYMPVAVPVIAVFLLLVIRQAKESPFFGLLIVGSVKSWVALGSGSTKTARSSHFFTALHLVLFLSKLVTAQTPKFIAAAEDNEAAVDVVAALSASTLRSTNLGKAVAARMPRITITTTSSIRVKPACRFICCSFRSNTVEAVGICRSGRCLRRHRFYIVRFRGERTGTLFCRRLWYATNPVLLIILHSKML